MRKINCWRRPWKCGKPLDPDLQSLIVLALEEYGCQKQPYHYVRGAFTHVSNACRVHRQAVRKVWLRHCFDDIASNVRPVGRPRGTGKILCEEDESYIAQLIALRPSIYRHEIRKLVLQNSNTLTPASSLSWSTIQRTVRHRLSRRKKYTWKRLRKSNSNRYHHRNIVYTSHFMDYVGTLDPYTVCFIDESNFNYGHTRRLYGTSECGTECLQVEGQPRGGTVSLLLLVTLTGDYYAEVHSGPTTAVEFSAFIGNALEAHNNHGEPIVRPGATLILDNASIHGNRTLAIISDSLEEKCVDYLFLPCYSPDLTPIEPVFAFLKSKLKRNEYEALVEYDLELAILTCCTLINASLMYSFYRGVTNNYMNLI